MKLEFKKPDLKNAFIVHLWKASTRDFVNPTRDWVVGLGAATLMFLSATAYIAFDFHAQFGAPANEDEVVVEPLTYRSADVKAYAAQYDGLERDFEKLRKDRRYVPPPPPIEPDDATTDAPTDTSLADTTESQ